MQITTPQPIKSLIAESKHQHPATMILLGIILIGTLLGIVTTLFAAEDRVNQINTEILQLENQLPVLKLEFGELDMKQKALEAQVNEVIGEKKMIQEGASEIRHQVEVLKQEKEKIQSERLGLVLGQK